MHKLEIILIKIAELLPTEAHFPDRSRALEHEIENCGFWTTPILVLDEHRVVLDGHHRLGASKALGLKFIPCLVVNVDNPNLLLTCWREGEYVHLDEVILRGKSGDLFPPKTTRFRLDGTLPECCINLKELKN